jgi:hypothetical protein
MTSPRETAMQYARLKALIKQEVDKNGQEMVSLPLDLFRQLVAGALQGKKVFDEKFYLASNPDVQEAAKKGVIESGAAHYYQTGYFEDKLPRKLLVDEKFYLFAHPDIAEAVRSGKIDSAQQHFETQGYREGRLPYSGFSLL